MPGTGSTRKGCASQGSVVLYARHERLEMQGMTIARKRRGLQEVAAGVYAIVAEDIGSNSAFVVGDDEVAVIDTQVTPTHALGILKDVRRVTAKPLGYVINTHHHNDHVTGNQYFSPPARLVGHVNVRPHMLAAREGYAARMAEGHPGHAAEFAAVRLTPPAICFDSRLTLHLEGRELQLCYLGRAHTDGDIVIYLPGERVLIGGDIFFNRLFPALHDGYSSEWLDVLDRCRQFDAQAAVPGHGSVGDMAELAVSRQRLADIRQIMEEQYQAGKSEAEAVAAVRSQGPFPNTPEARVAQAVRRVYRELRGELG